MATVRYDAKAKNGTYKSNGEEKTRWHQMGVCFQNDKGQLSIKIDSVPVNWDGWISLFDPKPKEGAQPVIQAQAAPPLADDDIPF